MYSSKRGLPAAGLGLVWLRWTVPLLDLSARGLVGLVRAQEARRSVGLVRALGARRSVELGGATFGWARLAGRAYP